MRMFRNTPGGIDRVEYAYAKELLLHDNDYDAIGVFTTPLFSGALPRERVLDVLRRVETAWRIGLDLTEDDAFRDVHSWLAAPIDSNAEHLHWRRSKAWPLSVLRNVNVFAAHDLVLGSSRLRRWVNGSARESSAYLHCSHILLNKLRQFAWLGKNGPPSIFFLHDAIPLEYPELCSVGAYNRHAARLLTVSKLASLVIVNSHDSRRAVRSALVERRARVPEIEVIPLGVNESFLSVGRLKAPRATTRYFLYVGTIESRKNLLFLLTVWRRLVEQLGASAPRLVIAGRRGWENENVIDILERSRALAPFVAEVSDLSDAGLASLMASAVALVAPSLAEGFGLPIAECLATGTPVLASDIAAHREVASDVALLIDPLDGPSWISAIKALMDRDADLSAELRAKIAGYRPTTWRAHVESAMKAVERVRNSPPSRLN